MPPVLYEAAAIVDVCVADSKIAKTLSPFETVA